MRPKAIKPHLELILLRQTHHLQIGLMMVCSS